MYINGLNTINKGSLWIIEQNKKHIAHCRQECKTNKEYSDEWCICMDKCYRLKYDSPDENITFCLPDSTSAIQSLKQL